VINREYWTNKIKTPTKLPSEIIRKCLSYTSKKDNLVCDPFLGSGQVAVVAKEMGRNYTGFEIAENYYNFAKKRLLAPVQSSIKDFMKESKGKEEEEELEEKDESEELEEKDESEEPEEEESED